MAAQCQLESINSGQHYQIDRFITAVGDRQQLARRRPLATGKVRDEADLAELGKQLFNVEPDQNTTDATKPRSSIVFPCRATS